MAKKATITDVSSGYASATTLNDNFTALNDAFDNTLSRDGSSDNQMLADLDMNSNSILNADAISATSITIGGVVFDVDGVNIAPWGVDDASNWVPNQDNAANLYLGSATDPIAGIYLRSAGVGGGSDGDNYHALTVTTTGVVRIDDGTDNRDAGFKVRARELGSFTGTHSWSCDEGNVVSADLAGAGTFNFSDLANWETVRLILSGLNSHAVTMQFPASMQVQWSGDTDFGGGAGGGDAIAAGTFPSDRMEFHIERQGNNIAIVSAEFTSAV